MARSSTWRYACSARVPSDVQSAAYWPKAGPRSFFVDRFQAHIDAINSSGLRMRVGDTERIVRVKAYPDCQGLAPVDLIIVLVESFHTRAAIESAGAIIGENTMVMSIQNGMGHEEILAEVVGRKRVLAAKTYVGGVFLSPGQIISGSKGKQTYIGELDGQADAEVASGGRRIQQGRLAGHGEHQTSTAPCGINLLVNVATGALCAITRLPYGPALQGAGD